MTKSEQNKYIKKLLDKWTKKLHLTNWQYELEYNKEDYQNTLLSINPCEIYCKARIIIHPAFWLNPKDVREQSIVHELIHCRLEPLAMLAYDLLDGKLCTREKIIDTVENVTQNLSTILCPLKSRFY